MQIKKQNNTPLISIIMPVKNAGIFLMDAVESIRYQTYVNWELIVVNDGSTDGTGKSLADFSTKDNRIKVITHTVSQGISKSLNQALKLAKGEYIARMDGDDISLPKRLQIQLNYLLKNPQIIAIGGQAQMIDGDGQVFALKRFATDSKKLRDMIMWMVPMQHPIMMVRGDVYRKCHYNETLSTAEDVDLMMQLLQYGEFGNVPELIYQYRKSDLSNGYHNVKKTFWLTILSRYHGITRFGYKPSLKGLSLTIIQLLLVSWMPAKWVVKLYETRRFMWIRERVNAVLSGLAVAARLVTQ